MTDRLDPARLPQVSLLPSVNQTVVDIAYARAIRAIARFLGNDTRTSVDTLYAPAPQGLSEPDIRALERYGWAEIRPMRGARKQWKVTLTRAGREERDKQRSVG